MTKEEQILSAILQDKARQCDRRCIPVHTGFLTPAELDFAENFCIGEKLRFVLEGGYEDAERRICIILPPDAEPDAEQLLCVLRLTVPKGTKPLTHRDYLGAVLGLGIDRSVTGDILVHGWGADIIVLRSMAEYLAQALTGVGRAQVSAVIAELSGLAQPVQNKEEHHDTVASLRLDSITASAFGTARGKAQEYVRQGFVFVNGRQVLKPDAELSEGDRISLRGKGKAVLAEVGGRTRKDRISITISRFL